ncbi:hypothetical protein JCM14036_22910 [Desulfotomaculum defluvii]
MEGIKVTPAYSNQVAMQMSVFDIRFAFANRNGGNQAESVNPDEVVAEIIMSPQHAKAFLLALTQNIRDYESLFGVINIEPNKEFLSELQKANRTEV